MNNYLKIPFRVNGLSVEYVAGVFVAILILLQLWNLTFGSLTTLGAYGNFGDEAVMTQASLRILGGQIPHLDFYSYAPGTAYLPLTAWMFFFGQDYVSIQSFNFLCALFLIVSVFWLGAIFSRRIGILSGLLFAFIVFPLWPIVSYHWQFLILAILSTRLLMGKLNDFRIMTSGLCLVLAGLLLPNKAMFLAISLLATIIIFSPRGARLKRVFLFMSAPMFVLISILLALLFSGLIEPVWTQLIYNNLTFYPTFAGGNTTDGILFVLFSLIFFTPLFTSQSVRSEWKKPYIIMAMANTSLMLSLFYFPETIHLAQVSAFTLVLILVALTTLWHASSFSIGKIGSPLKVATLSFTIIVVALVGYWWLGRLISVQFKTRYYRPSENQSSIITPRGSVLINNRWYPSIDNDKSFSLARQLPVMDKVLRTELANQRVFFFPFSPGYYYFYKKNNPTSYDLLPSSSPPYADEEKLKSELLLNADTLVYIKSEWVGFKEDSELMNWMYSTFPQKTLLLN